MKTRCFIALTIPADIQSRLADLQHQLKNNGANARWIKPKNIHITLRFLGDRDPKRVKQIAEAFPEIFSQTSGSKITIDSLDAFPNIKKMRTLWAGISDGKDETIRLFHILNDGLAKLGIPKDREIFIPHFTLARCKTLEESRSTSAAIKKAPMFSIEAQAMSVTFFQSTLHAEGSIYEEIKTVALNL